MHFMHGASSLLPKSVLLNDLLPLCRLFKKVVFLMLQVSPE